MSIKSETGNYLAEFTRREEELLAQVNWHLPERLRNWRFWIGDSQVYLNELKNHINDAIRGRIHVKR